MTELEGDLQKCACCFLGWWKRRSANDSRRSWQRSFRNCMVSFRSLRASHLRRRLHCQNLESESQLETPEQGELKLPTDSGKTGSVASTNCWQINEVSLLLSDISNLTRLSFSITVWRIQWCTVPPHTNSVLMIFWISASTMDWATALKVQQFAGAKHRACMWSKPPVAWILTKVIWILGVQGRECYISISR